MIDSGKDRLNRVVIALRDRVELVVVTAGTPEGQAKECRSRRVDQVGEFVLTLHQRQVDVLAFDDVVRPRDKEACRDVGSQSVASDLLADELIVRLVVVQRADHVVAVWPGVRPLAVRFESVGLAKANQVEPVPRPALAVARALQHFVNEGFPCVR